MGLASATTARLMHPVSAGFFHGRTPCRQGERDGMVQGMIAFLHMRWPSRWRAIAAPHIHHQAVLVACCLALQGCGTAPPATSGGPGPGAVAAGVPGSAQAGQAAPFEQVIKGAERQAGLLPIWKRQDKLWIELSPQMLGKPLFLSPKLATGIGEAGVLGGLMQSRYAQVGRPQWVEFRKVQQQVQLVAVNTAYTAASGTPQAKAVQAAFSPSLLAAVPLASAPDAKTGAVLIDASALWLNDVLGMALHLQRSYRQSYGFDARQSSVSQARSSEQAAVFEVTQHFATASIAVPTPGAPPGTPVSTVPTAVPDPRSLFVNVHYTLTPLPEQPMPRRKADQRVGYFTSSVADFTDDLARTPRRQFINRWRLAKKDPDAALSEPVQAIVFWLDPTIPDAYRATITEGVLAWNQAFEAIGFKNAIEVRTPPTDQPFDTLQTGHTSIRWMTNAQPAFGAIGPSHVDPRSGEILDAHIALESLSSRAIRAVRSQYLSASTLPLNGATAHTDAGTATDTTHAVDDICLHADDAAEQLTLGLDVLAAQGALDPDSAEVRAFVLAYLKDTTMHEVGHTLGLRHNFRASRWRTAAELDDPVLTRSQGNSASVMDYAPMNLPAPGKTPEQGGAPFQTTLGPYDFWAIAYGYSPLPADALQADQALLAIAERSADPKEAEALAYGTDEDNVLGVDPQSLTFDLGRDPVAFADRRIAIVQDLFQRLDRRVPAPRDDANLPRRAVGYGLRELARVGQVLMRQVGGVVTRRDAPGSRRDPIAPLPASAQREALHRLIDRYLAPQALSLPPGLQRRLAPDFMELQDAGGLGRLDVSVAELQLSLQRGVLAPLMSEGLAERLLDNRDKTTDSEPHPLLPQEVHARLMAAIWRPLPKAQPGLDAEAAERLRNLQREHVTRLAAMWLRPASNRADVRALVWQQTQQLQRWLTSASKRPADATTKAHLQACLETLQSALRASVVRAGG